MSAGPVTNGKLRARVARAFVIILIFLCIGPFIQTVLLAISLACYAALFEGIDILSVDFARSFPWWLLTALAPVAGLTGLIAGVYEIAFGRTDAGAIAVISLVISFAPLTMTMRAGNVPLSWAIPVFQAVVSSWFVASMLACWGIIAMLGSRAPAARSPSPP